jgi:small subunit ribosomal protein S15
MSVTKAQKAEAIEKFRKKSNDTGSTEVQVAVLTTRINALTEHMRRAKNDFSSRRGLLGLVSRRRRLLDYLKLHNPQGYLELISRLGIRK